MQSEEVADNMNLDTAAKDHSEEEERKLNHTHKFFSRQTQRSWKKHTAPQNLLLKWKES